MELFLIDKTDKSMKIGIKEADATLITPLLDILNKDDDVKLARYIETHPELDTPAIYVVMKEKTEGNAKIRTPSEAIKGAFDSISKSFSCKLPE